MAAVISQFICFDSWYPAETNVGIIAHRAGGIEAPENTVAGIEQAYRAGASGCEIDIQRTKDGYYVVNHDNTFERTAGDKRKPEEMDLHEVKELRVDGEPVAKYEEMLAAAKDKLILSSEADGIITDNVSQAVELKEELDSRSDLARMVDRLRVILSSMM